MNFKLNSKYGFLLLISMISSSVFAMDFDSPDDQSQANSDEQMFAGAVPDEKSPELEIDQVLLRESNPHVLGLGVGEAIPHASNLLSYLSVKDQVNALLISFGRGKGSSLEQSDGEFSFRNNYLNYVLDGSWVWWPVTQFPFSLQTGMTLTSSRGNIQSSLTPVGKYELLALGFGSGLVMESFFENGIWLHWNLISARYFKVFKSKFNAMTTKQSETAKENIDGLQIVGVANLTIGYAW